MSRCKHLSLFAALALAIPLSGCGGSGGGTVTPGGGNLNPGPITREVSLHKMQGIASAVFSITEDWNNFPKNAQNRQDAAKPKLGAKVFWNNDISSSEFFPEPGKLVGHSFDLHEGYFAVITKIEHQMPGGIGWIVGYEYDIYMRGMNSTKVGSHKYSEGEYEAGGGYRRLKRVITAGPKQGSYEIETISNESGLNKQTISVRYQSTFDGRTFNNASDYNMRPGPGGDHNLITATESINGVASRMEVKINRDQSISAQYRDDLGYQSTFDLKINPWGSGVHGTFGITNPNDPFAPAQATIAPGEHGTMTFADGSTKRFANWGTSFWLD